MSADELTHSSNFLKLRDWRSDFCWPERQDGDEDGLLVHMPTKHEGTQSTNQQAAQESGRAAGSQPQMCHSWLSGRKNKGGKRSFLGFVIEDSTKQLQTCGRTPTRMDSSVHTSVTEGDTEGKTECWNSCTKPPVIEARGSAASSSSFSFAPEQVRQKRHLSDLVCSAGRRRRRSLTQHNDAFVQYIVQGPDVGGPVGVAEASLEGKEPGQNLRDLTLKQQENDCWYWLVQRLSIQDCEGMRFVTMAIKGPKESVHTEMTMLPKANRRRRLKLPQRMEPSARNQRRSSPTGGPVKCSLSGPRFCTTFVVLREAVAPQQEHPIGWRHVQVDVFQVEQNGKQQCPLQVLSLHNTEIM